MELNWDPYNEHGVRWWCWRWFSFIVLYSKANRQVKRVFLESKNDLHFIFNLVDFVMFQIYLPMHVICWTRGGFVINLSNAIIKITYFISFHYITSLNTQTAFCTWYWFICGKFLQFSIVGVILFICTYILYNKIYIFNRSNIFT